MNIVNVGYDSTNYYVLSQDDSNRDPHRDLRRDPRLLVDVGWPGTLPRLLAQLRRKDIALRDISYLLVTHYHPDHAGLVQELRDRGMQLVILETQLSAIPVLKSYMKPVNHYVEIDPHGALVLTASESGAFLARTGIAGQIISTPGHSDDSVTLVLDEGAAFTGDLPGPGFAVEAAAEQVARSWEAIRSLSARTVYPGHGPVWPL